MTPTDIESVYETLAERLDAVTAEKRELMLAKLVLLLSHDLKDAARVRERISEAARNLNG